MVCIEADLLGFICLKTVFLLDDHDEVGAMVLGCQGGWVGFAFGEMQMYSIVCTLCLAHVVINNVD